MDSIWFNSRIEELSSLLAQEITSDSTHPLYQMNYDHFLDSAYIFPDNNRFNKLSQRSIPGIRSFANSRFDLGRKSLINTFIACKPLFLESNLETENLLYPNPTSDMIHIYSDEKPSN